MTTETKHETPLFSCCDDICRIERSLPAYMLAMSEKGPVCEECYDNWEVDRDWHDLPRFIPASDARIAELEAEVARLKNQSEWFYHGDDQGSDKCRFSVFEVIDEDVYYDDPRPGKKIVHITTARRCADIWAVVHIFSDAEKDERDDDEPYSVSEYATEEQARAALGEQP